MYISVVELVLYVRFDYVYGYVKVFLFFRVNFIVFFSDVCIFFGLNYSVWLSCYIGMFNGCIWVFSFSME